MMFQLRIDDFAQDKTRYCGIEETNLIPQRNQRKERWTSSAEQG